MGLVTFKHRQTGQLVKAEFPLAEMPTLVEYVVDQDDEGGAGGETCYQAKAFFLVDFEQVLPELPATDGTNVPGLAPGETPVDMTAVPVDDEPPHHAKKKPHHR